RTAGGDEEGRATADAGGRQGGSRAAGRDARAGRRPGPDGTGGDERDQPKGREGKAATGRQQGAQPAAQRGNGPRDRRQDGPKARQK
ncbi:SAM-dependent methyltransferase, partial [Mycobacterium tuberculosis]